MTKVSGAEQGGKIITFYSYKGGTGRSMALANVAWVLASTGKRVLAIDWDLEAPGLHRYFEPFLADSRLERSTGVIDFVRDFAIAAIAGQSTAVPRWYQEYSNILAYAIPVQWELPGGGLLHLVPAGKQDETYSLRVNSFDWQTFYERLGGGVLLEAVKENLRRVYDFILIDSRTGVSDTSGVCTIQMPDELVVCFTLNRQSIYGASSAARSALRLRRTDSGEPTLKIWPVPSRVEAFEKDRLEFASIMARAQFSGLMHHLNPEQEDVYWGEIAIGYEPYYAYEEVLAPFRDLPGQTSSMLARMETIAAYLNGGPLDRTDTIDEVRRAEGLAGFTTRSAKDYQQEFARLSEEYESIRNRMDKGETRTALMTRLLGRAQILGAKRDAGSTAEKLFSSGTDGGRVVGLALARIDPRPQHIELALSGVREMRSPFEQYQALLLAETLLPSLDPIGETELRSAISTERGATIRQDDQSRWVLAQRLVEKLGTTLDSKTERPIIFISYAHADEPERSRGDEVQWLSFVMKFLRPAVKNGEFTMWVDRQMRGGSEWDTEIERNLRACDIFVPLVSPNSMHSEYIIDHELQIVRRRLAEGDDLYVCPLLLEPTPSSSLDRIRDFNLRPRDAKPFSAYSVHERNQQMSTVANEIAAIATGIASRKGVARPSVPRAGGGRVFLTYSRKDGATFAASLRKKLLKQNLSIWQDLVALEGGRDWWSQIEEALRSKALQHFVLVVTPAALASPVVRREIRLARQEGKTVSSVKGPDLGDPGKLPRWLGQVFDLDLPEHLTTLIRVLQDQSRQTRVPMMAPEPPVYFVQRPAEFGALKAKLLDAKGDAVATSVALRGAGGYGKSTLAKALAHDPDIQDAYFDGVLWVELGESPDNLLGLIADRITILTGTPPRLATIDAAAAALGEALGERRILLVVDDVWREQDLRPFLQGGRNTTRLITTRLSRVLPVDAFRQSVDAMTDDEALELLSSNLPKEQARAESVELGDLAGRLGEWAQLLGLVNGFLRERVIEGGERLRDAIADANQWLDEEGLVAFDADDEGDRTKAVARTINLSLGLLDEKQRARFVELAVFPEDADIPIGIVARLWRETSGLREGQTKDLLSKFYGLSLLLSLDLNQRTFRFHDTIRRFLQAQAGKEGLVAGHKQFLPALDEIGASPDADALSRRYFYQYLPHHLAEAKERDRLDKLLLDPGWLKAKLSATGSPQALVADYEQHGVGELQNFIGRTLRLTTGILARDPRQLMPQLLGRIRNCQGIGTTSFLEAVRRQLSPPVILTERLSLTPPGAETARLEGHSGPVDALCMLPDGRLASGSGDNTIRLWDVTAVAETARLEGHSDRVIALCMLPDGRLASGSGDHTIHLWDVTAGAETARLEGHSLAVAALCVLPDGRLASGSWDNTIRLWDVTAGAETARLEGHSGPVDALCMLPDGRLASGSGDNTIRLWDVTAGAETARLEGHSDRVAALCVLPDGRLASGSLDNTIRLWDVTAGAETARLEGHSDRVVALCVLPDGRLGSGSGDNTIRLWDVTAGTETACLQGQSDRVAALCVLPDGRLGSGSGDNTIRLWDVTAGAETARLEGHSDRVAALCVLPDGRPASGSWDNTIRLWDVTAGAETARLEGHSDRVAALCVLPDGRLASGSNDKTIRLWDVTAGAETARLEGHSGMVAALCVLPDGRLASGSYDNTIRLWDVTAGAETARLEGHSNPVVALCMLPDGRLASGSYDKTIRLWDVTAGAETARLEGHWDRVAALCVLPDGRLASGSGDNTIRLWDVTAGAETARLKGHSGMVSALCMLPDGRLASGSWNNTIRLWDVTAGAETVRLEIDAPIPCIAALPSGRLVAGDAIGRLHWLEIVD